MAWFRSAVILAGVGLASCYAPRYDAGKFMCGPGGDCPSDYECGADNRCYPKGQAPDGLDVDGRTDGSTPPKDAAADAPAVDASLPDGAVLDGTVPDGPVPPDGPPLDARIADARPIDARPIDARPIDAALIAPDARVPDAGVPDAASPTTYRGTVSVLDVRYSGRPEMGHGGEIGVHFAVDDAPTIASPTGDLGCNAWFYDDLSAKRPSPPTGQGDVAITGSTGVIPPCRFLSEIPNLPGSPIEPPQYLCMGPSGMGAGTAFIGDPIPAGHVAVEIPTAGFTRDDVGRYMTVVTSSNPESPGMLPIVGLLDVDRDGIIELEVPYATAVAGSFPQGAYVVIAGLGPVPGSPSPEFLADADPVRAVLTQGGDRRFESFDVQLAAGAEFTLTAELESTLNNLPYASGQDLTFSNSGAGGPLAVVLIETSDRPVAGYKDTQLPPAQNKLTRVTCAGIGASVTVPASVLALVAAAMPTRIKTTYARPDYSIKQNTANQNRTHIIVGHAVVGFTTPP
jgi:hypothetical protein